MNRIVGHLQSYQPRKEGSAELAPLHHGFDREDLVVLEGCKCTGYLKRNDH